MKSKLWIILPTVGVTVIAFLVYFSTLAPSITWRNGGSDSGELAAAVITLGIPHPPGYPTYMLLGHLWLKLFPGQDPAYALNLLSAAGAALAAGLTTLTIFLLRHQQKYSSIPLIFGAILGGLFLAFAPLTWSQATITEVYAPGLVVLAIFTLLLFWLGKHPSIWKLMLIGIIGGLGIGGLPQMALAVLCAIGWLYFNHQERHNRWAAIWPFLTGVSLGLCVFLYLPLRASAHPLLNWGDPSNPARFWDVITAAQYQDFVGTPDTTEWVRRLFTSLNRAGQDLSWAGIILAGVGGYSLWQRDKISLGYLVGLSGLTLIFQTNYYAVINNWVYLLPLVYALAMMAGLGSSWLLTKTQQHLGVVGPIILGLILMATLGWRAANLSPHLNISTDDSAYQLGYKTLTSLPPQALIISERDEITFSLWYQQAKGLRPDVVAVDRRLLGYDWYRNNILYHYPDLPPALQLENLSTTRPVYSLIGVPGEQIILQSLE